MIIAIFPARANSKRVPNKNIKLFHKKPIISYPLKATIKSKVFDRIFVSTDSRKIGLIAKKYGADYLFERPKKLSTDHASTVEVIRHSINWISNNIARPKLICCIYPTSPLLKSIYLKESYDVIKLNKIDFIFSACKSAHSINRAFFLDKNSNIKMFNKKNFYKRTQDLKESYFDAAQFYWGTYEAWMNNDIIFGKKSKMYLLPRLSVQDIDTVEDWKVAETLFKIEKNSK